LKNHTNPLAQVGQVNFIPINILTIDGDHAFDARSGYGVVHPVNTTQKGRFSTTGWPDERGNLTLNDRNIDLAQGNLGPIVKIERSDINFVVWSSLIHRKHCTPKLTRVLYLFEPSNIITPMINRKLILYVLIILFLAACAPKTGASDSSSQAQLFIENKGSDTIVNLALAWAEAYQTVRPEVRISVTGGGSGTGIAALINGTVDMANASRQIKEQERTNAQGNGVEPVEFVIARDAIAIVINHENPIDELTIQQLSDIYSGKYSNWSELGGDDRPIVRLSRETNSGTHVYFLEQVLRQGDKEDKTLFSTNTLLLPSSEGITAEIRQNPNAIGYDGLGYVTDEIKVVAVAIDAAGPFFFPSAETVNNQLYPIARDLYMYTSGEPQGEVLTYLEWIMSSDAQNIVTELGFVPIEP
jgi:phosphate transport system substrate-binding protein